jgi:hypothetical protein
MAPADFLVLSQEGVASAGGLDMDAYLAVIEETLVLHQRGNTILPQSSFDPSLDAIEAADLPVTDAGDDPGRLDPDMRILVSPVGLGIDDVARATAVYRRADESGIGTLQRLWEEPIWT